MVFEVIIFVDRTSQQGWVGASALVTHHCVVTIPSRRPDSSPCGITGTVAVHVAHVQTSWRNYMEMGGRFPKSPTRVLAHFPKVVLRMFAHGPTSLVLLSSLHRRACPLWMHGPELEQHLQPSGGRGVFSRKTSRTGSNQRRVVC